MGLLSMLRKLRSSGETEIRILLLGLDNAGKTTLMKKLADEDVTYVTPTQGFNVKTVSSKGYKLNVWDIGGNKNIRPYWKNYFENADVVIYVVDSADLVRMDESASELMELLEDDALSGVPILVMANKQDVDGASTAADVASALRLDEVRGRSWQIQASCATEGIGLKEGLEWISQNINKKKR